MKKRFIEWHETCKCECKFRENVCNIKPRWKKTITDANAKN